MKRDSKKKSFVVDLTGIRSSAKLHAALVANLPLPECYGRNLDALHDILTEYGCNWKITFRNADPSLKGLRAVCADAMEETAGLSIVFDDGISR